jgi:Flp pilus assembly protein CpaB
MPTPADLHTQNGRLMAPADDGWVDQPPAPLGSLTPENAARIVRRRSLLKVLVGVVVVVGSFAGYLGFVLTTAPQAANVVVVARDLPAGTHLGPADLTTARVSLATTQTVDSLSDGALPQLMGRELAVPVFRNQLLTTRQLGAPVPPVLEPDYAAVTLAVRPENAAAGDLRMGDLVAVWTAGKDRSGQQVQLLLPQVVVYEVGAGDNQGTTGGTGVATPFGSSNVAPVGRGPRAIASVVLVVPRDQVEAVERAKAQFDVDLVLLRHAGPTDPSRGPGPVGP